MERKRTYVGLSTSFERSSIAIVSSDGELRFAYGGERILESNGGPTHSQIFASLIDKYCRPEEDIVLAVTMSKDSRKAREIVPPGVSGYESSVRKTSCRKPIGFRAAQGASSSTKQRDSQLISNLSLTFEHELRRARGWKRGVRERRQYASRLAHAAAACFTAPHADAICAVVDEAKGESCRCYAYKNGALFELRPVHRPKHEGNLGALYGDVCRACGFHSAIEEQWKVMMLAKFGKVNSDIHNVLRAYVSAEGLCLRAASGPEMMDVYEKLDAISRRQDDSILNAMDLACTGQAVFEETLYALLRNLRAMRVSDNLVLTGSCALNSSANGGILEHTGFKSLHVPYAPATDGNCIGAALLAYQEHEQIGGSRPRFQTPYLGFEFRSDSFDAVIGNVGFCPGSSCAGNVSQQAAKLLATGKRVGWISGRAEFGPRSLGNRSVLADPRGVDIRLPVGANSNDVFREVLPPFTLAVLHEYGSEYFDGYQPSPYGERALKFRLKAARRIPNLVQGDGRVQVQSVKRDWNERLYDLIFAFYVLTGIPMVINMNYARCGHDVGETLEDTLTEVTTSRADVLIVNERVLTKQ